MIKKSAISITTVIRHLKFKKRPKIGQGWPFILAKPASRIYKCENIFHSR